MTNSTSFVAAASATFSPDQSTATNFSMPGYDPSNLDTMITNNGISIAYLSFGAGASVGPNAAGNVIIPPGSSVLLTSNAAIVAASVSKPFVLTGPQATAASSATSVSALVQQRGGSLTITRGTASTVATF